MCVCMVMVVLAQVLCTWLACRNSMSVRLQTTLSQLQTKSTPDSCSHDVLTVCSAVLCRGCFFTVNVVNLPPQNNAAALPPLHQGNPWLLLYSTARDGISLATLMRKAEKVCELCLCDMCLCDVMCVERQITGGNFCEVWCLPRGDKVL